MRFSKALKLDIVTLEKVEETEEMKEDKKLKVLLGQIDEDELENEEITFKEITQVCNYYSVDYIVKDDSANNKCIICSSSHEDVVQMSFEDLEVLIENHYKEYGIK